jgi:hypothetical protein
VLASPISELESSFDAYNYALTVEWDQADQKFYNEKTDLFLKEISEIVVSKGVTKEEVLNLVEKKVASKELVDAMKLKLSMMGTVNAEDLASVLKENSKDFYLRGASWNSDGLLTAAYITGGAVLLGFIIWFSFTYKCVAYDYRPKAGCNTSNCYEKYCTDYVKR